MGVPTDSLRSGDRLLPTVAIGGLGAVGFAKLLDPFIILFMGFLNKHGVIFSDPEGWKDLFSQLLIVAVPSIGAYIHMRVIRLADNDQNTNHEQNVGTINTK